VLFLQDRIEESIEILKQFEPKPREYLVPGYYLAFSGGKDSVVLHEIARMSGVVFDSNYNITTADPPEVVQFIRKHYPYTQMHRPEISMWELIPKKLMPPTRIARYCCAYLKERGGEGRIVLTGVKKTDSHARRIRNTVVRTCKKRGSTIITPLLNWCDDEIWEFIHSRNLPYCELYDQGFKRLGCIGCPMAGPDRQRMEFERWPKYRNAYLRAFDKMIKERYKRGMMKEPTHWHTAEDVMTWWLQEDRDEKT
jgi:phosphoadenosine phosphosulfate reductase